MSLASRLSAYSVTSKPAGTRRPCCTVSRACATAGRGARRGRQAGRDRMGGWRSAAPGRPDKGQLPVVLIAVKVGLRQRGRGGGLGAVEVLGVIVTAQGEAPAVARRRPAAGVLEG